MRIIALMNQKGGVGKTTTTVNLGAALAELGKRVCLIDLDPQAHLTINYGVDPKPELVSMYDVLIDDRSFLEAVHVIADNVALVPSSIDLAAAEIELVSVIGRETLLKQKLESAPHEFDYILLDCPPSLGLLTINALATADEVIIPMQAHFLALQGVAKLLETVQLVNKRMNPRLKVGGIVLTMFDAQTKLSNEVVAELNGFIQEAQGKPLPWAAAKVFNTRIRRNIKLAECPSFGQTILEYDTLSNGALDYRNLAREIAGLPPLVVMPVVKPAAAKPAAVAVKPAAGPLPKPVMPPALVAAIKASAVKPVAVKPSAPAAAKPQAAVPPVRVAIQPIPATPIAKPQAAPSAKAQAPAAKPPVKVTVNPTIDQAKLAASNTPAQSKSATQEVAQLNRPARILFWVTVLYWSALFAGTHIPAKFVPPVPVNDKLEHFCGYGGLASLLFSALYFRGRRKPAEIAVFVLGLMMCYGAADEWTQILVNRDCELADWFADCSGACLAVVGATLIAPRLVKQPTADGHGFPIDVHNSQIPDRDSGTSV